MFIVTQEYVVHAKHRDAYLEGVRTIAEAGEALGCLWFEVYEDDDVPNRFMEMMAFDSWNHYELLRQRAPTREVAQVFAEMETWIEGGFDSMEVRHLNCVTQ